MVVKAGQAWAAEAAGQATGKQLKKKGLSSSSPSPPSPIPLFLFPHSHCLPSLACTPHTIRRPSPGHLGGMLRSHIGSPAHFCLHSGISSACWDISPTCLLPDPLPAPPPPHMPPLHTFPTCTFTPCPHHPYLYCLPHRRKLPLCLACQPQERRAGRQGRATVMIGECNNLLSAHCTALQAFTHLLNQPFSGLSVMEAYPPLFAPFCLHV